jgi:hypothetical protein
MKKYILASTIGLSVIAFLAFSTIANSKSINEENSVCHYGQCSKIKDDGYQCRNCAQKGSMYCWSHRD